MRWSEREFVGGDVLGRGNTGSPGSGGASPYQRRGPYEIVLRIDHGACWLST